MVRAIAHDTIKNDVDYSASLYGSCYSPLHLQCFLIWFMLFSVLAPFRGCARGCLVQFYSLRTRHEMDDIRKASNMGV